MRTAVGIGDQPVAELVAALGGERPTPAAGSAAAVTVAIAAGLLEKCARKAVGRMQEAEHTVDRATSWQEQALALADADVEAFRGVLRRRRDGATDVTMADAADTPLEIAALGVEVAAAAADLTAGGKPWLRGDAYSASLLAESAVASAAGLAVVNLAESDSDDGRDARARSLTAAARDSRARAEAAFARSRP